MSLSHLVSRKAFFCIEIYDDSACEQNGRLMRRVETDLALLDNQPSTADHAGEATAFLYELLFAQGRTEVTELRQNLQNMKGTTRQQTTALRST